MGEIIKMKASSEHKKDASSDHKEESPCSEYSIEEDCPSRTCVFRSRSDKCEDKVCEDYEKEDDCPSPNCVFRSRSDKCENKLCEDYETEHDCPTRNCVFRSRSNRCEDRICAEYEEEAECPNRKCVFRSGKCEDRECEYYEEEYECPNVCIWRSTGRFCKDRGVLDGYSYSGNGYWANAQLVGSESLDDCASSCSKTPECIAFNLEDHSDTLACFTYQGSLEDWNEDSKRNAAYIKQTASSTTTTTNTTACDRHTNKDVSGFNGGNQIAPIGQEVNGADGCIQMCNQEAACTAWVYQISSEKCFRTSLTGNITFYDKDDRISGKRCENVG